MEAESRATESVQVSVIVVTYNSARCIKSCLDSLLRTVHIDFEVLVLDNGSDDETLAIASKYDGIRLLPVGRNLGLCKARNMGAQLARSRYLAFIDHDTTVDPMWLASGIEELEKRPNAGPVQFRALSLRNRDLISSAGYGAGGVTLHGSVDEFRLPRTILFPVGAGFIISRAVFEKIGGFDEDFFVGDDDVDFGWRGWLLGYPSICIPTGTIFHDAGGFRKGKAERIFRFYAVRNRLCMYVQNLSGRSLLYTMPIIAIVYPLFALLHGRLDGLRALYHVLLVELRNIYLKRLVIQRCRVIKDDELMSFISYLLPARQFSKDCGIVLNYLLRNSFGPLLAKARSHKSSQIANLLGATRKKAVA
jgi:GT2 family glycosyltransferase